MDEFTIRTGVNVSHWLSQSDKRGEERKNYITRADFDTIKWEGIKWIEGNLLNVMIFLSWRILRMALAYWTSL